MTGAHAGPHAEAQEHDSWPAFVLPWDDTSHGVTDVSHLLETPAGKDGFIRVKDGRLATGDGRRWRFWGVGMVFASFFPPMELAETVARRLAKFGINCLRLHHLDHRWPNGILKRYSREELAGERADCLTPGAHYPHPGIQDTSELDPEAMARLDWFIACCKANGVYVDFNLNVTRRFSAADGVKESERLGYSKGITYFDDRLIALQKEYARILLTHVNPFTGNRYADEPAVALVEILNESSLFDLWWRGSLDEADAGATEPSHQAPQAAAEGAPQGPWRLPASYARDLDRRWNAWLARRYPDREALRAAWTANSPVSTAGVESSGTQDTGLREHEDAAQGTVGRLLRAEFEAASSGRFRDEARFYAELERRFFGEMAGFLRGELGVKQLLVPTSDWVHGYSGLPSLETEADLDVIDGHGYWQALFRSKRFANTAQLDEPDTNLVARLSRSAVAGKPYVVSEINESFPNDYAAEALPLLAAYGCLQDWDGFFWHSYTGGHFDWAHIWQEQSLPHHLRLSSDPMKMSQMAAGALLFLRGDVREAQRTVERRYPYEQVLDSVRVQAERGYPYWLPHLPGRLSLVHGTRAADFHAAEVWPPDGEITLPGLPAHGNEIISDTGELRWGGGPGEGRLLIDTPRHQAVVARAGRHATSLLQVELRTRFAAVQLASLDQRPIAEAERLLLVAAARVANTGMRWNEDRTAIDAKEGGDSGHAPTRIEPVQATLALHGLIGARGVRVQPLDGCGHPWGAARPAQADGGAFRFELTDEPGTTWYLLEVDRL
ncbi:MAG: GH148 [uncultured Chloroflexi bacterium]|uniref:GH148 n=1 Tax=uncultured Chloroflexota bacterium TaxID=166587 RepID=A0A6J4HLM8_9CHLR|nr:MAG: GH148 [uncultured Chloroflexota bacterium]